VLLALPVPIPSWMYTTLAAGFHIFSSQLSPKPASAASPG